MIDIPQSLQFIYIKVKDTTGKTYIFGDVDLARNC
jgi:hypothetical protein